MFLPTKVRVCQFQCTRQAVQDAHHLLVQPALGILQQNVINLAEHQKCPRCETDLPIFVLGRARQNMPEFELIRLLVGVLL